MLNLVTKQSSGITVTVTIKGFSLRFFFFLPCASLIEFLPMFQFWRHTHQTLKNIVSR